MTPEEWAMRCLIGTAMDGEDRVRLIRVIANAIRAFASAERSAEREACALRAEQTILEPMDYIGWSPGPAADDRAQIIARAIRARRDSDQ